MACTLIKALELPDPKEMPFQVVFSWSGGRFSAADGYGLSVVELTTTLVAQKCQSWPRQTPEGQALTLECMHMIPLCMW